VRGTERNDDNAKESGGGRRKMEFVTDTQEYNSGVGVELRNESLEEGFKVKHGK
jgi:hypothetical protein